MRKTVTSTMPTTVKFGALAPEVLEKIDHSDAVHEASSANYRYETKMASPRRQYDVEASRIRSEYLADIGQLNGAGEIE